MLIVSRGIQLSSDIFLLSVGETIHLSLCIVQKEVTMYKKLKLVFPKLLVCMISLSLGVSNMNLIAKTTPIETRQQSNKLENDDATIKRFMEFSQKDKEKKEQYDVRYLDMVERMLNMEELAYPATSGERTKESSAYNKLSRYDEETNSYLNWDQNWDEGHDGPTTEDGGRIFADIKGPGSIVRIWSANPQAGRLKIIIDGNETILNKPFQDYFNGKGGFPFTLEQLSYDAGRGKNAYIPITFQESCKIVAYDDWGMFYQVNYTSFPEGTTVEPYPEKFSDDQVSALNAANNFLANDMGKIPMVYENQQSVKDTLTLPAKGSHTLYSSDTSGAITGIKVKLNDVTSLGDDWKALAELSIAAYWDNETNPSVWTTLGGFFSSTTGIHEYKSLPLGVEADGTMYSYWYMPFESGANIVVKNDGDSSRTISYEIMHAPLAADKAATALRFHAKWNRMEDAPREGNQRFPDSEFLYTEGEGRYVGTSLHVYKEIGTGDPAYHDDWWWGEGDEKFFVDGETFPSWFGTGSEDYFGYAWGTWEPFANAYHSQPFTNGGMWGIGNRLNNRVHILDSVPFETSFSANLEKYHRDGYANMAVTNYWYLDKEGVDPYKEVSLQERTSYYDDPYPEPFDFSEAEDLKIVSSSGMDKAQTQNMSAYGDQWSKDSQLVLLAGEGGYVKTYLNVPTDGVYNLKSVLTKGNDFGKVQHYLDNQKIGSIIDLYDPNIIPTSELTLGSQYLTKGLHILEARIVGKNPSSKGTVYGMDYLKVEPQKEFRYEGEDLEVIKKSDHTDSNIQDMGNFGDGWSNKKHRVLVPADGGNSGDDYYSMTLRLPVEETGDYLVSAVMTRGGDFGVAQHTIDGKQIGNPVNLKEGDVMPTPEMVLGKMHLEKGEHEFTVKMVATATNQGPKYVYGLDFISLLPYEKEEVSDTLIYEAEQLHVREYKAPLIPHMQHLFWLDASAWGQQTHMLMEANAVDQFMKFEVTAPEKGYYDITTAFTKAGDFGTFQLLVNDKEVGSPIDTYHPDLTHASEKVEGIKLNKGKNTFQIKVIGKHEASANYLIGIDSFELRKQKPLQMEGEALRVLSQSENTDIKVQDMGSYGSMWSGNQQLVMVPSDMGASGDNYYFMNLQVNIPKDGYYDVSAATTLGPDFGVAQHYLDGFKLGKEKSFYQTSVTHSPSEKLGVAYLTKGTHEFGVRMTKTETQDGPKYVYGLDQLTFEWKDYTAVSVETTIKDIDMELRDNPSVDKIIAKLPTKVDMKHDDSSILAENITWDLKNVDLTQVGTYDIIGNVMGYKPDIIVNIKIKDTPIFDKIEPASISLELIEGATLQDVLAKLHTLKIKEVYSDGSTYAMRVVDWNLENVNLQKHGTYEATIILERIESDTAKALVAKLNQRTMTITIKVIAKQVPPNPETPELPGDIEKPEQPDDTEKPEPPVLPGEIQTPDIGNPNTEKPKEDIPSTNDNSFTLGYITLTTISFIGLAMILYKKRKTH